MSSSPTASFDIAVIGGGPGGYVAALRAAQLGARIALVERDRLGGTCLVRGCIPTKALLHSTEIYSAVQHGAELGVRAEHVTFDLAAAQKRKDKVVDQLVRGVESLLKSQQVQVFRGHGRLRGRGVVDVDGASLNARDIVIATGSVPARIPLKGVEHTIDSDGILDLQQVPERLAVIGGGVVGMEWGALFAALGTKVTVLEMMPEILPMVEADLVQAYRRHFERLGGVIHTSATVEQVAKARRGLKVRFSRDGRAEEVDADVVLLAAGRRPLTEGLDAEAAGVRLERGRVLVDDHLRAGEGVWAIGDVIGGIMLAHVASYEGICAVENIAGGKDRVPDYHAAPNCIYTDPEIAHVGLGEREAREQGIQVHVGKFPFAASGRAMTLGQTEGFIKVVTSANDRRILGIHMVGPRVTDVVAEATLAVQNRLRLDDLELTMHAHPTLAESLLEAALATEGHAIHLPRPREARAPAEPAALAAAGNRGGAASRLPDGDSNGADAGTVTGNEEESRLPRAQQKKQTQNQPQTEQSPKPPAVSVNGAGVKLEKSERERLLRLYHEMYLIRRFEERTGDEYRRAKIGGYLHLNVGEEASVVGGIAALKPGDYLFTAYREHGHAIARGTDPKAVMAELFGKETGTSHGRGGSMHIFDYAHRFMGGYGIVGGHLPLAVGAGFAISYRKQVQEATDNDIVFCMFGDGATNIGAFHESLNFAKVFKLPIVWFCVNNQYGMGTPVDRASAVHEIHQRACAYDMEAARIDGNNLLEVIEKTADFVERTRADSEPRFIEAVCYRFRGHSVIDPDKYRPDEEKQEALKGDPVLFFEHQLREAKIASDEDIQDIHRQVDQQVEETVKFADESPDPPIDELYKFLYAGEWGQKLGVPLSRHGAGDAGEPARE